MILFGLSILEWTGIAFFLADAFAFYVYIPRFISHKKEEAMEEVEDIIYGMITPLEEDVTDEYGKVLQPKGTIPIVAAIGPMLSQIPLAIASSLGEALKSFKMGSLGFLGNQKKQQNAMELAVLEQDDPMLKQILESDMVDPDLKGKIRMGAPLLKKYVGVSVTDLTDMLVKVGMEKIPAIKDTIEKVKGALVVANAEPVS